MASQADKDLKSSSLLIIECMMAPVRQRFKSPEQLTPEQLIDSVQTLKAVVQMITATSQTSTSDELDQVIVTLVKDVCLPILCSLDILSDSSNRNSEKIKSGSVVVHGISSCFNYVRDTSILCQLIFHVISPLLSLSDDGKDLSLKVKSQLCDEYQNSPEILDTLSSLELFNVFLNKCEVVDTFLSNISFYNIKKEALLKSFYHSIMKVSEKDNCSFSKSLNAVCKLLNVCSILLRKDLLSEIWHRFTKPFPVDLDGNIVQEALWQSLFAFYCFKDFLFPLEKSQDDILALHLGDELWTCLQSGFLSSEPSHRKLSMYLLKRLVDTCQQNECIVNVMSDHKDTLTYKSVLAETSASETTVPMFWWHETHSPLLLEAWEEFILLMETLEEKQVHVIKPLLSRMSKLVSSYSKPPFEDGVYLHTSWLMIIFIRCFQHESHFMSRWGAVTLLNLDFQQVPLIRNNQMKFLSQDLLEYLQQIKLYSRYNDTELGQCSPVGESLKHFFARLFASMNHSQKVEYLNNVLQKMLDNTWGSIPMVFLAQGLSQIPPEPLLGSQSLSLIRDVLQSCLTTHEPQTRGASQCFFGQMIMNLVDLESVSLTDYFTTLAGLNRDESFTRGTCLWENVANFLQNDKVTRRWDDKQILNVAFEFLKESKEKDEESLVVFGGSKVISISRMLLLFADAKIRAVSMTKTDNSSCPERTALEKSPLAVVLNEIQAIMSNIRSRSYISITRVDACLAVMECLGKEIAGVSKTDYAGMLVKAKLAHTFQYAVAFVVRRMSQDLTKPQDLDEIEFYCDVISTLGSHCHCPLPSLQELLTFVTNAFNLTTQPSANAGIDMVCTSAMKVLHKVLEVVHANDETNNESTSVVRKTVLGMKCFKDLPLPFSKSVKNREESFSKAQVGYVISSFLSSQWHCHKLALLLNCQSHETASDVKLTVESAMDALTLGSGNSDIAVFGVLELLIEKLVTHWPSLVPTVLDLAWAKVMEEKKNVLFWHKLEALVPVAVHRSMVEPQVDQLVATAVDEFTEKIFSLGQEKSGVIYLMVKHVCDSSLTPDEGRKRAKRLIPLFLEACDFGTVHKKGQKLWLDVIAYLESLGSSLATNQITSSVAKNDISTRIVILNWLSQLNSTVEADCHFVMEFLRALCVKYLEYAEATTYRHFINSLSHRQKHRMILILLLLSDFIREDDCEEFLSKMKIGLELECHPSVTHNLEWIMMRLFIRYPSHLSSLWEFFSHFVRRRSVCLCSLLLIICHIGPKLPKTSQLEFYNQAFPTVMPWTMAHHYTTRIFAQTCMTCLWQQCLTLDLGHVLDKFALIKPAVDFLESNSNASNTVGKLQDNFILSGFDPVRDFSAETIFHTLPRLTLTSDDEWISPERLLQEDESWQEGSRLIPLYNSSTQLSKCKEGPWKIKSHAESDDDTTKMHGDFQKKIIPWRQILFSPEDEADSEVAAEKCEGSKDGLIVVTSLLDKLPNLGGLCRTSEIFGVSQFVIGSMKHLEDRMFQSLSVSAQKWLNITEVIWPKVPDYLAEKRRDGYTLVGVEQTANSIPLDDYIFPKKSLLVLGNEKEGIPPDMIQTLDVCVEIPQKGIIRSLNVHVCGALIIWEYTRQHMKSQPSRDGQS